MLQDNTQLTPQALGYSAGWTAAEAAADVRRQLDWPPISQPKTRWYRVQVGGREIIHDRTGEPISEDFVLDGFNLDLPDTFLGLGTRDRIEAAALEQFPDKALIDFWPLSTPPADEF